MQAAACGAVDGEFERSGGLQAKIRSFEAKSSEERGRKRKKFAASHQGLLKMLNNAQETPDLRSQREAKMNAVNFEGLMYGS